MSRNVQTGATTSSDCQIVGIVANTKYDTVRETPPPIVYAPITSRSPRLDGLFFVIHARSIADATAAYRNVIHQEAPLSPETDSATFEQLMTDSMAREELLSSLSGFFAVLALLLSGIGIYGLTAWNVSQRSMEIGLRMAVGATRVRVFVLILRQIAILLALGLVVG